jgi:hypothetical protein
MRCDEAFAATIDELIDRRPLAPEARAHLLECADCKRQAEQLRALWRDLLPDVTTAPHAETVERFIIHAQAALGRHTRRAVMKARVAIAAVIAFATLAGGAAGYMIRGTPARGPGGQQFLLLIRGEPTSAAAPADPSQLVAEYRAWAQQLAREGRLVSAEKLADDSGRWLGPQADTTPAAAIGGYFLIRAEHYDEALRIARESPHVRYGGTIEVRRIENTAPPARTG